MMGANYVGELHKLLDEHGRQVEHPELWQDSPWKNTYYGLLNKVQDALEDYASGKARYWEVIQPNSEIARKWHLTLEAEKRFGWVGVEVSNQIDFYGQKQRKLRFNDGSEYWFYPQWLREKHYQGG